MLQTSFSLLIEALRYQHALAIQQFVPAPYMDEIFHVQQIQTYCQGHYLTWDHKITTPPGMYWIHLIIRWITRNAIGGCDVTSLRTLNIMTGILLATCFSKVISFLRPNGSNDIEGMLMALFPLIYFYSFLYYTDVLSTLLIFLSLYTTLKKKYKTSAMISFLSITVRQTNIIWVLFLISLSIVQFHEYHVKLINTKHILWDSPAKNASFFDYLCFIKSLYQFLLQQYKQIMKVVWPYIIVLILFGIFLICNKGIVLGDKTNHTVVIHLPQLFYFSVFTAFWGCPHLLTKNTILHFFKWSFGSKKAWLRTCIIIITMELIVYFNTKEHPFLISDNRHYTFYIWRRVIKAHPGAKYMAVPFYYASIWAILNKLILYQKISYVLSFVIATILVLGPVALLEFRYFIIPYLLWRASIGITHKFRLYIEALLFLYVNYITINVFLYKPFRLKSEPENLQRFMW